MNEYCIEQHIEAPPRAVWEALTNPEKIALYMFGSEARTTWKPGDQLEFYMEKDGRELKVVHGEIRKVDPPRVLEHTLFPSTWDMEDIPENHLVIRYTIEPTENGSNLTVLQTGFDSAENGEKRYSDVVEGWKYSLPKLKEVAEAI